MKAAPVRRLGDLLTRLPGAEVSADPETAVTAVVHDSRRAAAGAVFVAIRGLVTDANEFVDSARRKGAVAVVSEAPPVAGVPWVRVGDARVALAELSAAFFGDPARSLSLAGITGTNGKTTAAFLLEAALRAAGRRVGLLGTIQYRLGDRVVEALRTTPESSDLQALFREMVDGGCTDAVLEVSSHSLALARVHGCRFRAAVFTNLTRDHLDFHGDMDGYLAAKRRLFEELLAPDGHAVVNLDDPYGELLRQACRGAVWGYSLSSPAEIRCRDLSLSLQGSRFRAASPAGEAEVRSPLLGRFNVQNLLAAFGAAVALGVPPETAARGVGSVPGVPGRLERVDEGQAFTVVVDYAHTDDALRNLLETVRELRPARVLTVFGCGGDRDRSKRPLMGAVASRLSDVVLVTSDNPRSEPPEAIVEQIVKGMNGGRKAERHVLVDRREAIARALAMAGPGDVVVIAGKGHETIQTLRDRTVPFDDRQVAREALRSLLGGGR